MTPVVTYALRLYAFHLASSKKLRRTKSTTRNMGPAPRLGTPTCGLADTSTGFRARRPRQTPSRRFHFEAWLA